MAFETTYEKFLARVTRQDGEEEAQRICPTYARHFAKRCRGEAANAVPEEAVVLRRLADQMDPDPRQEDA